MTALLKPPVVLIHGMWSTADTLSEFEDALKQLGYETHTPSLPLHIPMSEHTQETKRALAQTSMLDYVAFLESYIAKLEYAPIVIGHSMGGLLAQMLATRVKCDRLILISSASPAGINAWHWSVVKTFGHNLLKFPIWKRTTSIGIKNVAYGIANTQSKQTQQEIAENSTYESGRASTELGLWFLFRNPPTKVNYSSISCPVLMISGTEDRITTATAQHKMKARFGEKAELVMIEGACHWTVGGTFLNQVIDNIWNWLSDDVKEIAA